MGPNYNPNSTDAVLARIEVSIDNLEKQVQSNHETIISRMEAARLWQVEQERRIVALEQWRYWVLGAASAAGGATAFLKGLIW